MSPHAWTYMQLSPTCLQHSSLLRPEPHNTANWLGTGDGQTQVLSVRWIAIQFIWCASSTHCLSVLHFSRMEGKTSWCSNLEHSFTAMKQTWTTSSKEHVFNWSKTTNKSISFLCRLQPSSSSWLIFSSQLIEEANKKLWCHETHQLQAKASDKIGS